MGVWLNIPSTSDVTSRDNGHSRVTTSLQSLLREPTDESAIKTLTEQLVANSWLRQSRMEYQLDRVEQSLTPGLQVKFLLWGLDKPEDFFDQPELWWLVLANEIKLTDKQLEELRNHQGSFIKERKQLQQLHKMLGEFRKYIQTHLSNVHYEIEQLKNLLTPVQMAKFFVYLDRDQGSSTAEIFGIDGTGLAGVDHGPISPSSPTDHSNYSDEMGLSGSF